MLYKMHIPQPPLAQFVECLWYVSGTTPYNREKVLPTKTIELMFNLGSPHRVYHKPDGDSFSLYKESWISGLHTEHILMEATAETNMLGVRFKPGGAYPFFDLPLAEIRNQIVDMDLIWGRAVDEIRQQLYEADTLAERFAILERMLLKRLKPNLYGLTAVQFAVDHLAQIDHGTTVKDLSHHLSMSQKHLISQFKKMVGLSPKQLARVFKFNHVLQSINPAEPVNWATIAHQCHYYDQAHFSKDFAAFSGFSPTAYLELRKSLWQEDLPQDDYINFVPVS